MSRELEVHRYDAFGVTIQSEFPLPELPSVGADDEPDVTVTRGAVDPVAFEDPDEVRAVTAAPGRCRLTYDAIGSVRVEDGERIVVDLEREDLGSSKVFRRLLQGQIVAVLLHQRGLLVLHASAVAHEGRAAVFVGPVGAGKTTTAAACYAEGFSLLDDDVVAIDLEDGEPVVHAGVPELKLLPETASALDLTVAPAESDDAGSPKRYHEASTAALESPVPLGACYRLAEGVRLDVTPLGPQERVLALVSNTYTAGLLGDTASGGDNLEQCARVANDAAVRELTRPESLERLPDLVELIAADLDDA